MADDSLPDTLTATHLHVLHLGQLVAAAAGVPSQSPRPQPHPYSLARSLHSTAGQCCSAAVLQGADHGPAVGGGEDVSPGDEDTGAGPDPGPAGGRDQDGEGELPGQGQVPTRGLKVLISH